MLECCNGWNAVNSGTLWTLERRKAVNAGKFVRRLPPKNTGKFVICASCRWVHAIIVATALKISTIVIATARYITAEDKEQLRKCSSSRSPHPIKLDKLLLLLTLINSDALYQPPLAPAPGLTPISVAAQLGGHPLKLLNRDFTSTRYDLEIKSNRRTNLEQKRFESPASLLIWSLHCLIKTFVSTGNFNAVTNEWL